MQRKIALILTTLSGVGILAFQLYYLYMSGAAEESDVWAGSRVAAYLLMFAGTLLLFLPPSLALRLGPLWLLGAGSWSLLGYVLLFVGAPDRAGVSFFTYAAFLALLFAALASGLAVPLAAVGKRLLPSTSAVGEMARALRQGSLLALFLVALPAMSPLGALNWLNALLFFTTVALTEFFFLARD